MFDYTGVQKHSGWKKIAQKQTMVDIPKWGVFSHHFSIVFLRTNGGKSWKVAETFGCDANDRGPGTP